MIAPSLHSCRNRCVSYWQLMASCPPRDARSGEDCSFRRLTSSRAASLDDPRTSCLDPASPYQMISEFPVFFPHDLVLPGSTWLRLNGWVWLSTNLLGPSPFLSLTSRSAQHGQGGAHSPRDPNPLRPPPNARLLRHTSVVILGGPRDFPGVSSFSHQPAVSMSSIPTAFPRFHLVPGDLLVLNQTPVAPVFADATAATQPSNTGSYARYFLGTSDLRAIRRPPHWSMTLPASGPRSFLLPDRSC